MPRKTKEPRFKLQRRLMVELPGLGKAGALERRPYPPGQHGMKRIKYSDFRLQLEEKQKIRLHYNLREEQLIRLVKIAKRKNSSWMVALIGMLECRLQNLVFRAGLAPSQLSAAQMISHGQVLVNGKKVTIRSQIIKINDVVSLTSKGLANQNYIKSKTSPRLPLPDWVDKKESDSDVKVILKDIPTTDSVPFAFDPALVTSYYSKV